MTRATRATPIAASTSSTDAWSRSGWRWLSRSRNSKGFGIRDLGLGSSRIPNPQSLIPSMFTDLRQALRTLIKSPGFSAIVVIVLAVGIGANTAIFSIVNGVLLKPLPFATASRLVSISGIVRGEDENSVSLPDIRDWRARSKTLDAIAPISGYAVTMTGNGDPVSLEIVVTTSETFTMVGATPLVGRVMTAQDDER